MSDPITSALNLMRRMPPSSVENSLAGLVELVPHLQDDLLNSVDQPLKVETDPDTNNKFILCDYNRDGDSYRSPWSNKYVPAMDDGFQPTTKLRNMEIEANRIFDTYRKLYFDTGYSSVYFFNTDAETEDKGFGACFLIHKEVSKSQSMSTGWWDSIHVFEVSEDKAGFEYKLTSTVMVSMTVSSPDVGDVDLSGSMTQQITKVIELTVDTPHLVNMGKMLEDLESRLRNSIEQIYIQKTREVISGMRLVDGSKQKQWEQITKSLNDAVVKHGAGRKVDSQ